MAKLVKQQNEEIETISIGNHTSALPMEVLSDLYIDYVTLNEGVYAGQSLLFDVPDHAIAGLGYKRYKTGEWQSFLNPGIFYNASSLIPQERMDIDLPGYAWDLLPYKEKPFDLYRSHTWHAEYQDKYRTPFASIYTSLGCKFKCNFCMINTINRTNTAEGTTAAESNMMRFWSPEHMLNIFDELINKYGVTTIRLLDEMFFLNKKYYEPLLLGLKERGYGQALKMWSYARVDTVNERFLDLFKEGGINWLALGIEAANQDVRREIYKGKFQDINIRDVVKEIHNHGMYVAGNYIFGHPTEKLSNMAETLELAIELNTEFANFYTAMALPGSPLYYDAKKRGWKLPDTPEAWSFHSYECQPLPTEYLNPVEVLAFRDAAWEAYHTNPKFQQLIQDKFGDEALNNIKEQLKIKLPRKILGDEQT